MFSIARAASIVLCLTMCIAGAAASIAAATPNEDSAIVAVFPPWWSTSHIFTAASDVGAVLDSGAFAFVLVVRSQKPALAKRLRAAGALMLLDPLGIGGCISAIRNRNV